MPDDDQSDIDGILGRLRAEFMDSTRDQLDDIDTRLDDFEKDQIDSEEITLIIQREVHNIKGQGATFGFPLIGRIAHMLEDYMISARGLKKENISPIRIYLEQIITIITYGEPENEDDVRLLLNSLPTGRDQSYITSQKTRNINVLLIMPPGMQRKMIANELLSCGFRIMRAYDCIEALSVAVDIVPDIVFVNYDMTPFDGRGLSNVFASVERLRNVHIVLLTSYEKGNEHLEKLPRTVAVVQKNRNFLESIGELMIEWDIFGSTKTLQ